MGRRGLAPRQKAFAAYLPRLVPADAQLVLPACLSAFLPGRPTCRKLLLGIGAYGRGFRLSDKTKTAVGSPSAGASTAQTCTGE